MCRYFHPRRTVEEALSQMKPGDYMFMEFGHNDQKQKGPGRGAYYSFATSLKTFIDEVRQCGGHPVLVTPTCRRAFKDGKIQPTHADYPDAVHWVAEREQVPLIDLQEMTRVLFEALGEEGSKGLSCIIRPVLIRGRTRLWPTTPISILTGHTR